MGLKALFPSQIWQCKIAKDKTALNLNLIRECLKFSQIDLQGVEWSATHYVGGYTSYASITNLFEISPYFEELKTRLDAEVKKYVGALQMNVSFRDLRMTTQWINIMPAGTFHTAHIHPLSVISGTYYLQLPQGSRGLKFEDPRLGLYMATPPRKSGAKLQNQWFVEMKPKVGEALLFESWMRHEVPPNTAKQPRISISFNYDWI